MQRLFPDLVKNPIHSDFSLTVAEGFLQARNITSEVMFPKLFPWRANEEKKWTNNHFEKLQKLHLKRYFWIFKNKNKNKTEIHQG